ncbi:hypothetical protein M1M87_01315 [Thermodesulfovibrionales bacterium]|nr:hypothetical protein [Thermodesulfovibrionales bacterium]MCL0040601.1 hypothetical protein [Thermodesulfovibrionales bacterium]MCL0050031.1 hypothetical protein [Thermodesulfovibrionales bacterium]MCL0069073.1 hypothetical protein [Thermodesulfovibrionales bacterium]MCL0085641.1 hypothetical protein [Thermodesulfovibrionales bacterium]
MAITTLKFQCNVADLITAMEKHSEVYSVVIESDSDAEGIIKCLIGIVRLYHDPLINCSDSVEVVECNISPGGEEVVFKLRYKTKYETQRENLENFLACIKGLQELILPKKREDIL